MNTGRLLLLRHGQSTWNLDGRWQGLADPPLSELGSAQATAAAPALAQYEFAAVYSSDLQRAKSTAEIISRALSITQLTVDPYLRERDVGDWTGMTTAEIHDRWPEVGEKRAAGEIVRPYGANNEDYEPRSIETVKRLCALAVESPLLGITHGGFIRTIEREIRGSVSEKIPNLTGRWVFEESQRLKLGDFFEVTDTEPIVNEDPAANNVL